MLSYIENKTIDWDSVRSYLSSSEVSNHWTNFGPVSLGLEDEVRQIMGVPEDKCVVACASGTAALHAIADLHNFLSGRHLTWAVSSFGFPCTVQGPFVGSYVVDCDEDGMIDLEAVTKYAHGIVVTNPFGVKSDLSTYAEYCRDNRKVLVVDAAGALDSAPVVSDTAVSMHHTKPWGMGEGGVAIVDREHERKLRSIINFGTVEPVGTKGGNGKISDIACAFILDRLARLGEYRSAYREQHDRVAGIARGRGWRMLERGDGTPTCVPLVWERPVVNLDNSLVTLRKYYKPLRDTEVATDLYSRIVNFPCHAEVGRLASRQIEWVLEGLERD